MEDKIIKEGFKKKWFQDKSGFWFEKKLNNGFYLYADPEEKFNDFFLGHINSDDSLISFKTFEELINYSKNFKG